jgi:hypothetical protein
MTKKFDDTAKAEAVAAALNEVHGHGFFEAFDADLFMHYLVSQGYLVMKL